MPDGLAAFIAARLNEAEAALRAIEDNSAPWTGEWEADGNYALRTRNGWSLATALHPDTGFRPGVLAHIAANDPARTLRAIAAKRAILAEHETRTSGEAHDGRERCRTCTSVARGHARRFAAPCPTLRNLGAEWDDHPAYQPEWAPQPGMALRPESSPATIPPVMPRLTPT